MIIQHNMVSANTNRQLGITNTNLAKSSEKLSSGYRINRAADDAAGLAISEKMRSQVRGLQRASDNAQDGISLIQTAEGAMDTQHAILQRTRELIVQASNTGTMEGDADTDVAKIQAEIGKLQDEFERINTDTEFNKKKLLDPTDVYTDQWLQLGANKEQGIAVTITAVEWNLTTLDNANGQTNSASLDEVDTMIQSLSVERSKLGAYQNRLEYTVKVDDNTAENLQAAESRIRDVDMAEEMTRYSKDSILQQAAQSMLAQANQATQGVLSLLR